MVLTSAPLARALALKILGYGVAHFVVAYGVTYALTRDAHLSLAVAVIEPFVQTVAFGLYDRLWHRIDHRRRLGSVEETAEAFTARLEVMDHTAPTRAHGRVGAERSSHRRVAVKTAAYTLLHFALAIGVVWALTRDWRIALILGLGEPLIQGLVFRLYDRLWTPSGARGLRSA